MLELIDSIKNSIEIVGKLRELSKKVAEADLKMLLADLSSELGDAKLEAANLKSELADLREENAELKRKIVQRGAGKPSLVDAVYRFDGEDGNFCTACFDVRHQKVQVRRLTGAFTAFGTYECPSCNATFG